MNKETLKYIIQNFHEKGIPFLYERKLKLPLKTKKVIAVIGIRRSGKTYLAGNKMKYTLYHLDKIGLSLEGMMVFKFQKML